MTRIHRNVYDVLIKINTTLLQNDLYRIILIESMQGVKLQGKSTVR